MWLRPLLIRTKLLTETHEVKFRWADLTKLWPKFRARKAYETWLFASTVQYINYLYINFSFETHPVLVGFCGSLNDRKCFGNHEFRWTAKLDLMIGFAGEFRHDNE